MSEIHLEWLEHPQDVGDAIEKIGGPVGVRPDEFTRGYVAYEGENRVVGAMLLEMPGGGIVGVPEVTYVRTREDDMDPASSDRRERVMDEFALEVGSIATAYGLKPESIRWPSADRNSPEYYARILREYRDAKPSQRKAE